MRPRSALLTIILAVILATTVIGVGTRMTVADATNDAPAMRSL